MPGIAYTLGLDARGGIAGLQSMRTALAGFTGLIGRLGPLLGIAGGIGAAGAAIAGFKSALDMGGELTDLANRTGEGIAKLTVFRQALADVGVGAGSAGQMISLMQKAMTGLNEDGQPTVKAFGNLGLKIEELKALSPVAQIEEIGAAIGKVGNPAERAAAAMQIFGRSGAEMNQLFADGAAIKTATRSLGSMPALLQQNAALFDEISDSLGRLKGKGQALFVGIASQVADRLQPLMAQLDGIDFGQIGVNIGSAISSGLDVLQSGKLGEIVGLSLKIGFEEAINFLLGGLRGAANVLIMRLSQIPGDLIAGFKVITDPGLWTGLYDVLRGVASGFVATIASGLAPVVDGLLDVLKEIPGVSINFDAAALADVAKDASGDFMKSGFAQMGKAFQPAITQIQQDLGEVSAAFKEGFNGPQMFDTSASRGQLGGLTGALGGVGLPPALDGSKLPGSGLAGVGSALGDGQNIKPLGDRLSKIGGFIGGAGGARGEKAAQDTARNTSTLVQGQAKMNEQFSLFFQNGAGAGATF